MLNPAGDKDTHLGVYRRFPLQTSVTHLTFCAAALHRETRAMDRGRDTASSQRFSYFGSSATGEEGEDGACAKQTRINGHRIRRRHQIQGEAPTGPDITSPKCK